MSERERLRSLRTFDEPVPRIPQRSKPEVEKELRNLRRARRHSGRKSQPK
jgi:hypothetical protein